MNYTEFFASVKNGSIAPCYLFEGEEEYTKHSALLALRKKLIDPAFQEMNDSRLTDPGADALIAANETFPFMADKRLVTVFESGMLSGKAGDYDEDKAVERLKGYLPHLPDSSCLVFYVRGKADGRKKLYAQIKKYGVIVTFDRLDDKSLVQWIAKEFKNHGQQITVDGCERLYFSAGRDLTLLSNEIEKISAYAADKTKITGEDVEAICTKSTEYKLFELAGVLLEGSGKKAFDMLEGLLREGESRVALISLLGRQCRQMQTIACLMQEKKQNNELARLVGVPPFALQKLVAQTKKYSLEQIDGMVAMCLESEYQFKSGQIADEGSLERIMLHILSLCAANKKAGRGL